MAQYTLIEDFWPLVICVAPREATPDDTHEYVRRLRNLYARNERMIWLHIMPHNVKSDRVSNQIVAAFMKENRESSIKLDVAIGFVSKSTLMRFILAGWFLTQPIEAPYACFTAYADCISWLRKETRGAWKLPMPSVVAETVNRVMGGDHGSYQHG